MFKFFPSNHAALTPIDCPTNDSLNETIPGGPSPDTAVPLHDEAIDRPYRASAESAGTESRPPPQQPSWILNIANTRARYPRGLLSSEARGENNPSVVSADGGTEKGSLSEEARHSMSVESRHPNRRVSPNVMIGDGDGAFVNGATSSTAADEAPDVGPSLQLRVASADEKLEQRVKAAISKEKRAFRPPIQNRPSSRTQ